MCIQRSAIEMNELEIIVQQILLRRASRFVFQEKLILVSLKIVTGAANSAN